MISGLRGVGPDNPGFIRSVHSNAHVVLAESCFRNINFLFSDRNIPVFNIPIEPDSWTLSKVPKQDHIIDWLPNNVGFLFVVPDSGWGKPRAIGFYGRLIGMNNAEVHKTETDQAYDSRASRNPIKPFGYPNLPFPEAPLGGAVAIFLGVWLSNWGIEHGPLSLWIGGWLIMVAGGIVFVLWALPYRVNLFAGGTL